MEKEIVLKHIFLNIITVILAIFSKNFFKGICFNVEVSLLKMYPNKIFLNETCL